MPKILDIKLSLWHDVRMPSKDTVSTGEPQKAVERKKRKLTKEEEENRQRQIENNKLLKEHNNRFLIWIDTDHYNLCWKKKGAKGLTLASTFQWDTLCLSPNAPRDCEVGTALARIFDKVEGADKSKLPDMETKVNRMVEELFS